MQLNNTSNIRPNQNYRKTTLAYSQFLSPNDTNPLQFNTKSKKLTFFEDKNEFKDPPNVPAFLQNKRSNFVHRSMIFNHTQHDQSSPFQNPFINNPNTNLPIQFHKKKITQIPTFRKGDFRNLKQEENGRASLFQKAKSPDSIKMYDKVISEQKNLKSSGNINKISETGKQMFSPIHPKKIFSGSHDSPNLNLENKQPSIQQKEKDQKSDQKSTISNSQKSYKIPQFLKKGSPLNKSGKSSDYQKLKKSDQLFLNKKTTQQSGSEFQSCRERKSSAFQLKYSGFKNYVETQTFSKKKTSGITSASFAKTSNTPQNLPIKTQNFNFQFGRLSSPSALLNRRRGESTYSVKKFSLNDFEIVQKIGKGAFGDVFIARQKAIGFLCVLKKISKKKIKEQKLEECLMREIKIQSYLQHKHLTTLYGLFDDQDYLFLILQILPDGSMSQVKKKKRVQEMQAARYLRQVCQGLRYMHKQDVIHRDIKPQNILMYEDYLKLGDFGCAIYTQTLRKTIVGCLAYISPEQLNNQSYDEKIDVWSLGILSYELITGKAPFEDHLSKIYCQQIDTINLKLQFPPDLNISEECKNFISSLLTLNPNERMTIDEAIKHPFITKCFEHDRKIQQQVFGCYQSL